MGWVQGCLFSYSHFLIEMCPSYHTIHWIKNPAICHLVALETEFSFLICYLSRTHRFTLGLLRKAQLSLKCAGCFHIHERTGLLEALIFDHVADQNTNMPQRFGLHCARLKAQRTKFDLKFIKSSSLSLVLAPIFCLHCPLFPSVCCSGRRLEA